MPNSRVARILLVLFIFLDLAHTILYGDAGTGNEASGSVGTETVYVTQTFTNGCESIATQVDIIINANLGVFDMDDLVSKLDI